ncbi:MAG: hypothetical protein WCC37_26085, partial [Candidatus Sulfotelmatobacter sp.]
FLALSVNAKEVSKANSEQSKSNSTQSAPEKPSTRIEINVGSSSDTPTAKPQEQHPAAEAKPTPITHGEWLIAGITAVYAFISYFTFRAIERQAEIAQDNTDALIAGQRAWVMVEIELNPAGVVETSVRGEAHTHGIQIRMHYRNDGQTPCWITERRASLILITDNIIPERPDLSKAEIIARGTIPLAVGKAHGYGHFDTPLHCPADYSPDRIHLIYGVVRYRTAFKGRGETIFGYRVMRGWDRLERLELSEWNNNT